MSPAHVQEPTYQGLKARLRTGAWPLGTRLEAAKLADELGVSVTPVRDSLNRLVGERLVEFWPGEGYRVARLTERTLRDLFLFNRDLLIRAAAAAPTWPIETGQEELAAGYPERVAQLFSIVAAGSGNTITTETIAGLNDRLHPVRCLDPDLITRCDAEIEILARLLAGSHDLHARDRWLTSYHDRRSELAGEYVLRLELGPKPS